MSAPVDEARDEYADAMNLELRQSIAARVLEAMDVDQYLIDAVRNAKPPVDQMKPAEPTEYGSIILARSDEREQRVRWMSPTSEPGWYSEFGAFVGGYQMLRDVEVLRIGVGERPDVAPEETDDYKLGASDFIFAALRQLRQLRAEAVTSERKNAYDVAIKTVEDLQP